MAIVPLDVRRLSDALLLGNIVAALEPLASYQGIPAALGQLSGGPYPYVVVPRQPPSPAWVWCDAGTQVVVAIRGIYTAVDGLTVFASAAQPFGYVGNAGVLRPALDVATAMLQQLGPRYQSAPRRWVLVGHSYGGVCALVLAALLWQSGAALDVQVLTLGSPRPGDSAFRDVARQWTVRRLMGFDDPVPRFPPQFFEAPALSTVVGPVVASQWGKYTQPSGGLVLYQDGTLATRPVPLSLLPVTDVDLAAWVVGDGLFGTSGHRLNVYLARIGAALQSAPDAGLTVGSNATDIALSVAQSFLVGAAAGAAPVPPGSPSGGSAMAQGYIPPLYKATWKHTGTSYIVLWMGQIVLYGTNRSNAKSLARAINSWLRRMQGAASAPHSNFNAALAAYWLVCSSSSAGFIPPLVVT